MVEILVGLGFKESDAILKMNDVISNNPEIKDNLEEIIKYLNQNKMPIEEIINNSSEDNNKKVLKDSDNNDYVNDLEA